MRRRLLATSLGEAALLAASHSWWNELGIEAQAWTATDLAAHEPKLTPLTIRGD